MRFDRLTVSIPSILFKPFEQIVRLCARQKEGLKPIWIIGAPRSGTTLMYQIMCMAFKGSYLSNRVAKRYRIALIMRTIERIVFDLDRVPKSFESNYGRTIAPGSPHEGGQFFYEFFPKEEPYCEDLNPVMKNKFKKAVSFITSPRKIFISKNTYHSLRIKALKTAFPNSRFIWVTRNKTETIHSIIHARHKNGIPNEEWWSVKPKGWQQENKRNEIEKIIWQVEEIESVIEKSLVESASIFLKIDYEEICNNPRKLLNHISEEFDMKKDQREVFKLIPEKFEYSKRAEDEILKKIKSFLNNG